VHMARLLHESRNLTSATRKGQNLEISFGWVYFLIFLKEPKYKKIRARAKRERESEDALDRWASPGKFKPIQNIILVQT
jgi:hypothetical protein